MPANCSGFVPTRLVLFGARRTGSSLLVSILRTQAAVMMHGEIFHTTDIRDPVDGWAGAEVPSARVFDHRRRLPLPMLWHAECHSEGRAVVGLKVFRDHLRPANWPKLTSWCDVCVVLRRRDVNAQFRSLVRARRTGRWKGRSTASGSPSDGSPPRDLGTTDDEQYRAWAHNQAKWYQEIGQQLAARGADGTSRAPRVVQLTFEDHLVGRNGSALDELWQALRLQPPPQRRPRT